MPVPVKIEPCGRGYAIRGTVPSLRVALLWVTGYAYVRRSNDSRQIPSQKSLSSSLVSLFSRSLLFDSSACRALRSSCHSPTYSRASLMLFLTCSISAAMSRSIFSRKSINSTTFLDAEADRRVLGCGETEGGGEVGRPLREGPDGEQVIVMAGTGCEGWNVRDELEEEESESVISGRGIIPGDSVEHEGAVGALVLRRYLASDDSDKRRGEVGMSS